MLKEIIQKITLKETKTKKTKTFENALKQFEIQDYIRIF